MGERVDKLRIRDTKLLNKNFGIENEINLKYDVLIPEKYLNLSPKDFVRFITRDLEEIVQKVNISRSEREKF